MISSRADTGIFKAFNCHAKALTKGGGWGGGGALFNGPIPYQDNIPLWASLGPQLGWQLHGPQLHAQAAFPTGLQLGPSYAQLGALDGRVPMSHVDYKK